MLYKRKTYEEKLLHCGHFNRVLIGPKRRVPFTPISTPTSIKRLVKIIHSFKKVSETFGFLWVKDELLNN
jgi:hypothetical protein